jgi:cell volume regulation protein A
MQEVILQENATSVGRKIVDLGIPASTYIMLIKRDDVYISPKGSTVLQANDRLSLLAEDKQALEMVKTKLGIINDGAAKM